MTPERWRRVKELLAEALELPTVDQGAWLDRSCAGDEGLREQAQALLSWRAASTDFLETPASFLLPDEPQPSVMRRRIGPYKVLRRLGRGGMGTVYLATRDGSFTEEVAIKLFEAGRDREAIASRFEKERCILARLRHPGIAQFLDDGPTADGRPYLVMEYVEGEPVDRYCNRRALSIPDRLSLFRRICSAVAFAHKNLVVHRDLKPANILVSATGEPKLLDFGIAELLAAPHEERQDPWIPRRAMTPAYASPEQLRGEGVTPASDIFSLGVILHELLTGERPPRAGLRQEPGQVTDLDVDLDGIVGKALAPSPAERYSSAVKLSGDVGRYLKDLKKICAE